MRAINLSPLDGDSMVSISMLPELLKGVDIEDYEEFWTCVEVSFVRYKQHIYEKREEKLRKIRQNNGTKH